MASVSGGMRAYLKEDNDYVNKLYPHSQTQPVEKKNVKRCKTKLRKNACTVVFSNLEFKVNCRTNNF